MNDCQNEWVGPSPNVRLTIIEESVNALIEEGHGAVARAALYRFIASAEPSDKPADLTLALALTIAAQRTADPTLDAERVCESLIGITKAEIGTILDGQRRVQFATWCFAGLCAHVPNTILERANNVVPIHAHREGIGPA